MNVKNLLLTHFSQRYPKIPDLKELGEGSEMQIGIAFDLMRIGLQTFRKLSRFSPALKLMFEEPLLPPPQVPENPFPEMPASGTVVTDTSDAAHIVNPDKPSDKHVVTTIDIRDAVT